MAAHEGYVEVLEKSWYWAKEMQLKPEELWNEVWLSKNKHGRTVLQKLSEWAKELQLEPEELRREDVFVKRQVRRDGMAYGSTRR